MRLAVFILLAAVSAEARPAKKHTRKPPDPRTAGLGHSCRRSTDCRNKSQRCLKTADMNGKQQQAGFCVLPCAALDAGTTKVEPGQQLDPQTTQKILNKTPPPRCPAKYQCHAADASTPIDICVKD